MEISYDSEGRILACSPVEGVLSGENILSLADKDVPEDLLRTFALGSYIVRKGKIVAGKSPQTGDSSAIDELTSMFPAIEGKVAKSRRKKSK